MKNFILILLSLLIFECFSWAEESIRFPDNFRWCVATAAHQIEGYNNQSDWWDWEQVYGHIQNAETSGAASDHWNRVPQDIQLMKQINVGLYRFSIEWAKIEPEEGKYDLAAIEHYRDEVAQLRANKIEPFITLHHFTLPRWVAKKGGLEWAGFSDAFDTFTQLVYEQIAPGTPNWVTFNEPMVYLMGAYFKGVIPPGEKRGFSGLPPVMKSLLRAHAKSYHTLHRLAEKAHSPIRVGMAHHLRTFDPWSRYNPLDQVATHIARKAWNWALPSALETGTLRLIVFPILWVNEEIPNLKDTQDFVGVNYYSGDLIQSSFTEGFVQRRRDNLPKTDMGWDIYPEGFYRILNDVAKHYKNKPILITENGIADATDHQRIPYLKSHLEQVSRAIHEGIPIEGYCYWSLIDNFEWLDGFRPRFGLFEVNYSTQERIPRKSAEFFKSVTEMNGFNASNLSNY